MTDLIIAKKCGQQVNESVDGKKYRKSTNNGLRAINIASGSSDMLRQILFVKKCVTQ